MLDFESMDAAWDEWAAKHGERAQQQGWFLCDCRDMEDPDEIVDGQRYGYRPWQVQKLIERDELENDEAAWKLVCQHAEEIGEACHEDTLEFLREHSPYEFRAVVLAGGLDYLLDDEFEAHLAQWEKHAAEFLAQTPVN